MGVDQWLHEILIRYESRTTVQNAIGGGVLGLAVGVAGVYGASWRYPAFRHLTLPFKAFVVTSAGSFTCTFPVLTYVLAPFLSCASHHRGRPSLPRFRNITKSRGAIPSTSCTGAGCSCETKTRPPKTPSMGEGKPLPYRWGIMASLNGSRICHCGP